MKKVIAFCGFESSGKSYSAKRLMTTMGFEKISFANTLRDIAFSTIGIPFDEGMLKYDELKKTELINGLNFRNILENLGSAVRKYDEDFWARGVLNFIKSCLKNVCIDDLRYPNEYRVLKNYCELAGIEFKLIFCDYHSENYRNDNIPDDIQEKQIALYKENQAKIEGAIAVNENLILKMDTLSMELAKISNSSEADMETMLGEIEELTKEVKYYT